MQGARTSLERSGTRASFGVGASYGSIRCKDRTGPVSTGLVANGAGRPASMEGHPRSGGCSQRTTVSFSVREKLLPSKRTKYTPLASACVEKVAVDGVSGCDIPDASVWMR